MVRRCAKCGPDPVRRLRFKWKACGCIYYKRCNAADETCCETEKIVSGGQVAQAVKRKWRDRGRNQKLDVEFIYGVEREEKVMVKFAEVDEKWDIEYKPFRVTLQK